MFKTENMLFDQLCKLRDEYNLMGVKAEFEAEGSSFRDLIRLRRLTSKAGIKFYLKIGGVEAIRDIKDSLEIAVDGLIAPMVETKFGVKKFVECYNKTYGDHRINLTLNIETQNAILHIDDILEYSKGKIDNITIGRTDLSGSYFSPEIRPDTDFILDIVEKVGEKLPKYNISLTMGGSVSINTVKVMKKREKLQKMISKIETRKIMFPTEIIINQGDDAIKEALKFEELYIISKKEFSDMYITSEISRLTELKRRT